MKKTLFLSFSQTGQTTKAMQQLSAGLSEFSECDFKSFSVEEVFPFPWKLTAFFRIFPRAVLGKSPQLIPIQVDFSQYDLIVLGGPIWFLSPSLPLQSLLSSPQANQLEGKKVLVLLTCRNLWCSALRILNEKLIQLKAKPVGSIVVCEVSALWASFVTTPRWMLTGKKEPFAFFPAAGIQDQEFNKLPNLGRQMGLQLVSESWQGPFKSTNLDRLSLRWMDQIGRKFFEVWASFIYALAPKQGFLQDLLLVMFRVNLVLLILCLLPITKLGEGFFHSIKK